MLKNNKGLSYALLLTNFLTICLVSLAGQAATLKTVPHLNPDALEGNWYEIATIPHYFLKDCIGTTARLVIRNDGRADVHASCFQKNFSGSKKSVSGTAWLTDDPSNAKLKVKFVLPNSIDIWVVALGRKSEYVVFSTPNRKYAWIVARSPKMSASAYNAILRQLQSNGFNPKSFVRTLQQ